MKGQLELWRLAAVATAGHRFYLLPLLPLLWLVLSALLVLIGFDTPHGPASAQVQLIGFPLTMLAVFLGLRVIAGEIDGRTLEIAYTVPGGCDRVWWAKLVGAWSILLVALALLAIATWIFFTRFSPWALYGALQGATFYLVFAMAMAALLRSEVAGAMATAAVLAFNMLIQNAPISPMWNPGAQSMDPTELLARTLQNRIGVALAIAAILALAFMRASRRERMLGG